MDNSYLYIPSGWTKPIGMAVAKKRDVKACIDFATPIIVHNLLAKKEYCTQDRSINVECINYFSHTKRRVLSTKAEFLVPIDSKRVVNNRKVKHISTFDYSSVEDLVEYITENGAVTLVLDDPFEMMFMLNDIDTFTKKRPYTLTKSYIADDTYATSGKLRMLINIISLQYVIPIFNKKKVDGFGVNLALHWGDQDPERIISVPSSTELFFVVNKHKENIFLVDSSVIKDNDTVNSSILKRMKQEITGRIKSLKEMEKR